MWRPCPHNPDIASCAGAGAGLIRVFKSADADPVYRGLWFADGVYPLGRIGPFATREAAQRAVMRLSRRALRRALRSITR